MTLGMLSIVKNFKQLSWKSSVKINEGLKNTFLYKNNYMFFKSIKKKHITTRLGKT